MSRRRVRTIIGAALLVVCVGGLSSFAVPALAGGVARTKVVDKPQRFASDLCAVTHGPNYEVEPCHRHGVPVKLIAVRLQTTSPTTVGISAAANATLLSPGSREVALIVSVDGRTVRTEHVLLRHGKVPDFLVTRLVPVSNGVHLVTLSVLAGSEEMDGIEIVSSGLRTAEGEIPRWARPGE